LKIFFGIWLILKISDDEKRPPTSGKCSVVKLKLKKWFTIFKNDFFFRNYISFFGLSVAPHTKKFEKHFFKNILHRNKQNLRACMMVHLIHSPIKPLNEDSSNSDAVNSNNSNYSPCMWNCSNCVQIEQRI
jgi:hypothetical protein